jgi:hypothetical protein
VSGVRSVELGLVDAIVTSAVNFASFTADNVCSLLVGKVRLCHAVELFSQVSSGHGISHSETLPNACRFKPILLGKNAPFYVFFSKMPQKISLNAPNAPRMPHKKNAFGAG